MKTGSLRERDNYRAEVINVIISRDENLVPAVTPISYADNLHKSLKNGELLLIELYDTPYHIFQRFVFSDEEDNIYMDDRYKNAHKTHYIREIGEDLRHYGAVNASPGTIRINVDNDSPERIRDRIITEYIQGGRK